MNVALDEPAAELIRGWYFTVDLPASFRIATTGIEQMPVLSSPRPVRPQRLEVFTNWKSALNSDGVILHFYVDDLRIRTAVTNPLKWSYALSGAEAVISPDMSLYAQFPPHLRRYNTNCNRLAAAAWQKLGINVITNVRWNDPSDYAYCFDGVPRNCQVAVSSVSMMRNPKDRGNLVHGYQEMLERLAPTSVIWYGAIPTELPPSAANRVEIIQVQSRAAEAFTKAEF